MHRQILRLYYLALMFSFNKHIQFRWEIHTKWVEAKKSSELCIIVPEPHPVEIS